MKVEFLRFAASDGVLLQGWLSECEGDLAVIHIHGMSGNGYENYFLDELRQTYTELPVTFLTIDTRGRGIMSEFRIKDSSDRKLGGSCYEIFDESANDIQGAVDYLKSIGKTKFILQGHSLGASKVVNYLVTNNNPDILGAALLAPTDMVGWANLDPRHPECLRKAEELLARGKPLELVGAQCWEDNTPLSAQTYQSITAKDSSVDIYAPRNGQSLLSQVKVPMLIAYGDKDVGLLKVDGSAAAWQKRVEPLINDATEIKIIDGANHGYRDREKELAKTLEELVRKLS